MRGFRKYLLPIIICALLAVCAGGCGSPEQTEYDADTASFAEQEEQEDNEEIADDAGSGSDASFAVHVLDVGQGLSVLIEADGCYMLYDGGGRDYSSYVVAYLRKNGIDTLDYLVASHYDEDHISGLVGVLNTTDTETALTPDYVADSNIYRSFRTKLESSGASEVHPESGDTFALGPAEIQIVGPSSYDHEDENDNSIAVRIVYGTFSCILTGDASANAEAEMIASGYTLDSDLYVVGHHGSSTSSSEAFVAAVSPSCAVISVGAGNSYGHPTEETLSTLEAFGVEMYRTDIQGEISCYSDGMDWWIDQDNPEEETSDDEEDPDAREYVLNTHTMKFHYPDCDSVSLMNEENKEFVTENRETLIQEGYSPCGNCKP